MDCDWRRRKSRVGSKFQAKIKPRITLQEQRQEQLEHVAGDRLDFSELDELIDIGVEVSNFDFDAYREWARSMIPEEPSPERSMPLDQPPRKKRKKSKKHKKKKKKKNKTRYIAEYDPFTTAHPDHAMNLHSQKATKYVEPVHKLPDDMIVGYKENQTGKLVEVIQIL